jgi:two-component system nitrogen regulation response regulator NtrX
LANRGTLFLDEVGDLGPDAQAKLLRAIETGAIERVGGGKVIEVDVRILSATNHDLRAQVEESTFRQDLLFRLEVVPIHLPPLRERKEDIPLLVAHVLQRLRHRQGLPTPHLTSEAMDALSHYSWPGNVRELMNSLERMTILSPGGPVDAQEVTRLLPVGPVGPPPVPPYQEGDNRPLRDRMDDYERALIQGALEGAQGNVAEAGRRLKTDRPNLYRRMKRLGLRSETDTAS